MIHNNKHIRLGPVREDARCRLAEEVVHILPRQEYYYYHCYDYDYQYADDDDDDYYFYYYA